MVEKGNADCEILKPLDVMSTSRKEWREAIRDFVAKECGWGVTSLDKCVLFGAHQGFGYGYGGGRDTNLTNLDKGILKADGNPDADEKKKGFGRNNYTRRQFIS